MSLCKVQDNHIIEAEGAKDNNPNFRIQNPDHALLILPKKTVNFKILKSLLNSFYAHKMLLKALQHPRNIPVFIIQQIFLLRHSSC